MAPRLTTEAALAYLAELRKTAEHRNDLESELRPLLRHRSNFVIAKAAGLVEELSLERLASELLEAFPYFMQEPVKRDPGCSAKLAIVNALSGCREPAAEVFLAGVEHIQLEPAWGEPVDTAATLRALCGRALMGFGHADAFRWHARLIADPEPMTRALAVETLSGVEDERAELLLRSKIAREPETHEPEPGIEMDAFDGLMKIAPEASFEFVARYLEDAEPHRVRAAALALGSSRHPGAFVTLQGHWQHSGFEHREVLALPIALLRSSDAFQLLIDALTGAPESLAEAIVEALAIFREDAERAAAVQAAVEARNGARLMRSFSRHFEQADEG